MDVLKAWNSQTSNLDSAIAEVISLCKQYGVRDIVGDRFGSSWIETKLSDFNFEPCKLARSQLYVELMPILNANEIQLLDEPVAISQLKSLERRRGRDGLDHLIVPAGKRDERAFAIAGLAYMGKEHQNIKPIDLSEIRFGGSGVASHELLGEAETDWSDIL